MALIIKQNTGLSLGNLKLKVDGFWKHVLKSEQKLLYM